MSLHPLSRAFRRESRPNALLAGSHFSAATTLSAITSYLYRIAGGGLHPGYCLG